MQSLRYVVLSLCLGIIAVWAGENMFWFMPPADLRPLDLFWTVIAYSIASAVGLNMVIWSGVGGWPAAFLGGAVMGYMAEGVIVGTIYNPLPFFWVWTPLAWHALISAGLVLGIGRAAGVLGPARMALIWAALGLAAAYWGQYWTSERAELPSWGALALYLLGFGVLVVLAQVVMDRMGTLPRPPLWVMLVSPAIALFVWGYATVADMNPLRVILPLALLGLWWVMRRLGQRGGPVSLGRPVPVWQHALVLITPAIAVALAPVGWSAGVGTLGANWAVALPSCALSVLVLARLAWRAARQRG